MSFLSVRFTLACALICVVAVGCGGNDSGEYKVVSGQQSVYDKLKSIEADVEVDENGEIVAVTLNNDDLKDGDLAKLAELTGLTELTIETPVTDAAIEHLSKITSLKNLDLGDDTQISSSGLQQLRSALPGCSVSAGDDDGGGDDDDDDDDE